MATSVIGIDVKDLLVAGAFGDVGAGVEGGGSGGSTSGAVQEEQRVQQEEVIIMDTVGVLQGVVVQPLVY